MKQYDALFWIAAASNTLQVRKSYRLGLQVFLWDTYVQKSIVGS